MGIAFDLVILDGIVDHYWSFRYEGYLLTLRNTSLKAINSSMLQPLLVRLDHHCKNYSCWSSYEQVGVTHVSHCRAGDI